MRQPVRDPERFYAGLPPEQRPLLMALQAGSVIPLVLLAFVAPLYPLIIQLVCVGGLLQFRRRHPGVQASLVALTTGVVASLVTLGALFIF